MKSPRLSPRNVIKFGRRRAAPHAGVVDNKPHIRTFLAHMLEDLGFVVHQCDRTSAVTAASKNQALDLVVLGLLAPESEVTNVLRALAADGYQGKVMLFGGSASTALLGLHDLGEQLGLAMLPPLGTPFRDSDLQANLSVFLPIPPAPEVPIDVEESLRNGWLELWYQPKIDLRRMSVCGAKAVVRVRHPEWGVVPTIFIPSVKDPRLENLSEFVIGRAIADWNNFAKGRPPLEMSVPLPMSVLEDSKFIDRLCLQLPDHAVSAKLTIELNSIDVRRDLLLARKAARQFESYNVAVSIDDVMAEASWIDTGDFPIAELQVDPDFIHGCAGDRHKRSACGMVVSIAERLGARATAKGIEATSDLRAVRDMGFDLGQGALFAKPMDAHTFARTMLRT